MEDGSKYLGAPDFRGEELPLIGKLSCTEVTKIGRKSIRGSENTVHMGYTSSQDTFWQMIFESALKCSGYGNIPLQRHLAFSPAHLPLPITALVTTDNKPAALAVILSAIYQNGH